MPIGFIDRLKSNNPQGYGIVAAKEVAGHKTVKDLESLYKISDPILSLSGKNEDNDAIGQQWYVSDEGKFYQLVDWDNRHNATGWEITENITYDVVEVVFNSEDLTDYSVNGDITSDKPFAKVVVKPYDESYTYEYIRPKMWALTDGNKIIAGVPFEWGGNILILDMDYEEKIATIGKLIETSSGNALSGKINLRSLSEIKAAQESLTQTNQIAYYLITDSNGSIPSTQSCYDIPSDNVKQLSLVSPSSATNLVLSIATASVSLNPVGVNVGDLIAITRVKVAVSDLTAALGISLNLSGEIELYQYKILPTNDVKAPNTGDSAVGVMGLASPWDKQQINKINGIESTANNALPKSSQLPSRWTDNMNNALQTGVYPWCTLGRPEGSTGAYTCIVRRTSTDDGAYNTIEQTAYGREGELGKVYKRIIFEKNDGTDTQYGEWLEVTNSGSNIPEVVVEKREDDTLGYNKLSDVNENDYIVKIIFSTEGLTGTEICIGIRTNHYVNGVLSHYTISWWSSGTIHYTYIKYTEESPDTSVAGREFFIKREYVRTDSKITAAKLAPDVTAMIDERIANAITTTLNTEV